MNEKNKERVMSQDPRNGPYKPMNKQYMVSYMLKKASSMQSDGSSPMRLTEKMSSLAKRRHIQSHKHNEIGNLNVEKQPMLQQAKLRLLNKKLSQHKLKDLPSSAIKNDILELAKLETVTLHGNMGSQINLERSKKFKEKKQLIYFTKGNNHQLLKEIFVLKNGFAQALLRQSATICWLQSNNQKEIEKNPKISYEGHLPDITKKRSQHSSVVYNYLEGQSQLTNKQKLYRNMRKFYPQAIGNYIPKSFIINFRQGEAEVQQNLLQFLSYYFKKDHNKKTRSKSIVIKNYFVDITVSQRQLNKIMEKSQLNNSRQNQIDNEEDKKEVDSDQPLWILKPTYLNRGRGIHLFSTLKQLSKLLSETSFQISVKMYSQSMKPNTFIIQEYIQRPLLIDGYKFDMRFWALIQVVKINGRKTLKAYLFRHGYSRLASVKYGIHHQQKGQQVQQKQQGSKQQVEPKEQVKQQKATAKKQKKAYINNRFIHLTNNAVQKQAKQYGQFCQGNQLSLQDTVSYFKQRDSNSKLTLDSLMQNATTIVTQSINSVKQRLISLNSLKTFQLLGYDFLLDQNYNMWFIQVNCNPCLEQSSQLVGSLLRKMLEGLVHLTALQDGRGPNNSEGWIQMV